MTYPTCMNTHVYEGTHTHTHTHTHKTSQSTPYIHTYIHMVVKFFFEIPTTTRPPNVRTPMTYMRYKYLPTTLVSPIRSTWSPTRIWAVQSITVIIKKNECTKVKSNFAYTLARKQSKRPCVCRWKMRHRFLASNVPDFMRTFPLLSAEPLGTSCFTMMLVPFGSSASIRPTPACSVQHRSKRANIHVFQACARIFYDISLRVVWVRRLVYMPFFVMNHEKMIQTHHREVERTRHRTSTVCIRCWASRHLAVVARPRILQSEVKFCPLQQKKKRKHVRFLVAAPRIWAVEGMPVALCG